uniref:Nucleolar protein 16 n=1 Tax=Castor canadensis TaxID=51338 RepID=A0A8C0WVE0_CASCN
MPKAKGKTRKQKFGYNVNRKRLNRNARRKAAPRIECSHIRHAWDRTKSVRQNLAEMGLAMDPNKAVPFRKRKVLPCLLVSQTLFSAGEAYGGGHGGEAQRACAEALCAKW